MSKPKATPTNTWPSDSIDFSPGLAAKLNNLNQAVVLSTVHAQLQKSKNVRDGQRWVFYPLVTWQKSFFPWWSLPTVERTFKDLKDMGLLIKTDKYNARKGDRTLWYRIDYDELGALIKDITPSRAPRKTPRGRVNDAGTGLTVDVSGVSVPAPAPSEPPDVDVGGSTTLAPLPTSTPTATPNPSAADADTPTISAVSAPAPQRGGQKPKASLDEQLKAHGLNRARVVSAMSAALRAGQPDRTAVFRHMRMHGVIVPFELQQPVIDTYYAR